MTTYDSTETFEGMAEDFEGGGVSNIIGDAYGGDFRFRLLMELIADGELTTKEAEDVLRWTEPSSDPNQVIGLVAGQFDVTTREIEKSLKGTEFETAYSDIESSKRTFKTYKDQVWGAGDAAWDVMKGFMSYPFKAAAGPIRDAIGLEGGIGAETGPLGFSEDSMFSSERKERTDQRGNVADTIRREIDRLVSEGYMSHKTGEDLKSNHAGNYGYDNYTAIIDGINESYEKMDDKDQSEILQHESIVRTVMAEREFADGAPETTEDSLTSPGTDEVAGIPDADGVVAVDGPGDDIWDFQRDLYGDGVFFGGDEIQRRERATYLDAGIVYDRSTGQSYSVDEWNEIKTDPEARARYETSKSTAPGIQDLLNKPFFKDQVTKEKLNDPNITAWEHRMLTESLSGGPQIPIEDLAIPSLSPTHPWETSTFDFRQGDGRGQWMAMTPRERTMRIKLMKDQGLISESQWSAMGGEMYGDTGIAAPLTGSSTFNLLAMGIWEQAVGLSSDIQVDPLQALQTLGQANRIANAPRGGSAGRAAPKYSVPASLREIPDYKTLATETRSVFRGKMGRDMEDWELALLSDELGESYKDQNEERIKLHRAAWEDAVAGGTMDVDFGEVEDPNSVLQYDIEESYANEIDRSERVEDRAMNRSLLMDSISTGRRMIG